MLRRLLAAVVDEDRLDIADTFFNHLTDCIYERHVDPMADPMAIREYFRMYHYLQMKGFDDGSVFSRFVTKRDAEDQYRVFCTEQTTPVVNRRMR